MLSSTLLVLALASTPPVPSTFEVSVKVLDGDGHHTLLDGATALEPNRPMTFTTTADRGGDAYELSVVATPEEDGRVVVHLEWMEKGERGRCVQWRPTVALARGAAAQAQVVWPDGGRRLELKVR